MKNMIAAAIAAFALTGCVITPYGAYVAAPAVEVAYEPDVVVGGYYIGYYNPGFGYWTGVGWDFNFYAYGHPGYGHYYRGAPRGAYWHYRSGPHYRGGHGHR